MSKPDAARLLDLLLALIVGGLAIALIDRPTPDRTRALSGTLFASFAGEPLNRIALPAEAIEPVALRTTDGGLPSAHQIVRSRDGSRHAFVGIVNNVNQIYVANADGTDARPVSTGPRDSQPAIAPDGAQIAYMTNYAVSDGSGEIWVIDADGQNQHRSPTTRWMTVRQSGHRTARGSLSSRITTTTAARSTASGETVRTRTPSWKSRMAPSSFCSTPVIKMMRGDLPAPFSPSSAHTSPS